MRCKGWNRHKWNQYAKCHRCGKTCDLKGGKMFRVSMVKKEKYDSSGVN